METFEIKKEFLLNGQPFKILSGAIHYFRIHPYDWEHSLYNLKALGFNTVETYVPWNLHEPQKGEFHFEDRLDLEKIFDVSSKFRVVRNCATFPIYLCRMGVWGISCLATP